MKPEIIKSLQDLAVVNGDVEVAMSEISGLNAALQISRDSERQTKERLNSVSEELLAEKAENRRLRDEIADLQIKLDGEKLDLERIQLGPDQRAIAHYNHGTGVQRDYTSSDATS